MFGGGFGVLEFCVRAMVIKALEVAVVCCVVCLVWVGKRLLGISLAMARWVRRNV